MIKLKHMTWVLLVLAAFVSLNAAANCSVVRKYQTIEIVADTGGMPVVIEKTYSDPCHVDNNKHSNLVTSSHIKWKFSGLNCQQNHCRIAFHGNASLLTDAYKCVGHANNKVCHLYVNKAKDYCKAEDPSSSEQCTIQYDIMVGQIKVDPSIIIKPRPY